MKAFICGLAALLLLSAERAGAQECDYEKNEIDKFTLQKTIRTAPANVVTKNVKVKNTYNISKIDMQMRAAEGKRSVVFIMYFSLGLSVANTNGKAIVLLSNGDRLELPCLQNVPNTWRQGIGKGTAVMATEFGVDEEAFARLCLANITDVRVVASVNPVDFTIKDGLNTFTLFRCLK